MSGLVGYFVQKLKKIIRFRFIKEIRAFFVMVYFSQV